MDDIKKLAKFKWHDILINYLPSEFLTGKHGPCPLCGGKDRYRFIGEETGSYICSQCGAGSGIHLLSKFCNVNYFDAWRMVEKVIGSAQIVQQKQADDQQRIDRVKAIIDTCKPVDSNVKAYLSSRCIKEAPESLSAGLCWLVDGMHPAMIAKAVKGSKIAGLHATFIKDGKKVDRKMYALKHLGMVGSAIRLHRLNGGNALVIGEGLESSLSASILFGLPAWAAMDAGKLEQVDIPDQITYVSIAADNDENFTGQKSAYILANRLVRLHKKVDILMPPFGKDWNDVLCDKEEVK